MKKIIDKNKPYGAWEVGDVVTLWYLDFKEKWKVLDIKYSVVDPLKIHMTSRADTILTGRGFRKFIHTHKWINMFYEVLGDGYIRNQLSCIRHTYDSGYPHMLLSGKMTDTRVIDGHHRLTCAIKAGIETVPIKLFVLGGLDDEVRDS